MRGVGFEPTQLSLTDLKPVALTTRPSSLKEHFTLNVFYLYFYIVFINNLSSRYSGYRLDVVAVEVALEVEVGEGLTDGNRKKRAEGAIGLDVMLVLEVVGLDVLVDGLGDLRAAHERRRGLTEEREELGGHLRGALEDGRGTLDLNTILIKLDASAALAGILHLAMYTLL